MMSLGWALGTVTNILTKGHSGIMPWRGSQCECGRAHYKQDTPICNSQPPKWEEVGLWRLPGMAHLAMAASGDNTDSHALSDDQHQTWFYRKSEGPALGAEHVVTCTHMCTSADMPLSELPVSVEYKHFPGMRFFFNKVIARVKLDNTPLNQRIHLGRTHAHCRIAFICHVQSRQICQVHSGPADASR